MRNAVAIHDYRVDLRRRSWDVVKQQENSRKKGGTRCSI